MCIVAPALVIALKGPDALVDHEGRRRHASTILVPDLAVGDWVLVGSGAVLRRLDDAEALELLDTIHAAEAATADAAAAAEQGGQP